MKAEARVRALVVDDEPLARRRLSTLLAEEPAVEIIGEAGSGSAAVEAIASQRPDLLFLDVQMPGLDGFGVLRCTAGAHVPVVVFVTAHDEHAIRAFDVHAADYLLKPVTAARLREAVRRAVARVRTAPPAQVARGLEALLSHVERTVTPPGGGPRIPLRVNGGTMLVFASEILWIEADGDYLRVHTGSHAHIVRASITDFTEQMQPFGFVRVHRSALINSAAVSAIHSVAKGGHLVVLLDGTQVRSGRKYREVVQKLRAGSDWPRRSAPIP